MDTLPEFVQDVAAEVERPEAPAINLTGWETVRFQLDDAPAVEDRQSCLSRR
jgi:hypothetical protein